MIYTFEYGYHPYTFYHNVVEESDFDYDYSIDIEEEDVRNFIAHKQKTEKCAVLVFSEDKEYVDNTYLFDIGSKYDTDMQAHMIFAALRATDSIDNLSAVYVHITGDKSGLNLALFNRLLKASAYNIISLKEELK